MSRSDHLERTATTEGFTAGETAAMRRALEAALQGPRGANPLVGAVLIDRLGRVLHVGHHRGAGTPHAEADVLEQARRAGTELREATIVVSLEPCDHTGRTGPCTEAILAAGIPRAVFAIEDDQDGAGGAQRLRAAGLDDVEIADVIHGAAFFNWANRLMLSLGRPVAPAQG